METEDDGSDGSVTEQGFGGDVTVRAELNEDGTIKELIIETPNETEGLGKRASEAEFIEQFIGKAGPFTFGENGIEALSGATVTSTAALAAINKAAAAGESASAEATTEEKPEEVSTEAAEASAEENTKEAEPEETKTEEKPSETVALDGQVYGSYRSTQENDFSKVTVSIGTKNGQITSCKIQSEGDQDLLTDEIRNEWAKAITESGSAAPDAITGASLKFSAQSVQDAVTEILAQINGEASVEHPVTAEAPAEEKTEEAEPEGTKTEEAEPEETKTEEKSSETAASDGQVYGSYRSTQENDFSKVTVSIGTKNSQITSCKIQSEGDQDLLTDEIRNEWAKAIVESGSAAPDAITGASLKFSAQSVQDAVTEILAQINGETASENSDAIVEPAEEKTEEPAPEAAEAPAEEPVKEEEPAEEKAEEPAPEAAEPAEEPVKEEAPAEEKAEEKTAETEKVPPAYAGYRTDKENDFSKITVIASAKGGKLASMKILSEGEQDLLTDEIRGEWAKAIVESGSAAPDAITGATLKFSAQSVQDAVTEILEKVNGEAAAAEETVEPAPETAGAPAEEPVKEEEHAEEKAKKPAPEAAEAPAEEPVKEEEPAEEKPEEKAEEPAAEEKPAPAYAGYRVDRENDFSKVTVIALAKGGKLTSLKILSTGAQDLLTDEIRNEWANAILESGSAAPDAITGATLKFSAQSVLEAAGEILSKTAAPGK